MTGKLTIRA